MAPARIGNPFLNWPCRFLTEKSKDLEVICYLIETLVRLHGFSGLNAGFRLCRLLVERYWDDLFPLPDIDGVATRTAPLMGLNGEGTEGTLIIPVLNVPLTNSDSIGPLACCHYDQAVALESIADAKTKSRRIDQGITSLKTFLEAVADTPNEFYLDLELNLRTGLEEFQRLRDHLDTLCGKHAPHSSRIKNALTHCHEVVLRVAGDRIKLAATPVESPDSSKILPHGSLLATCESACLEPDDELDELEIAGSPPYGLAQGIPSRDHALLLLEAIADYFRKTEPLSPIAYTLEQAVRWGRMSLPELLTELIPDGHAREYYYRMVGIQVDTSAG